MLSIVHKTLSMSNLVFCKFLGSICDETTSDNNHSQSKSNEIFLIKNFPTQWACVYIYFHTRFLVFRHLHLYLPLQCLQQLLLCTCGIQEITVEKHTTSCSKRYRFYDKAAPKNPSSSKTTLRS